MSSSGWISAHLSPVRSSIKPIVHLNPGSIGLNPSRFTRPEAARLQTIIGFATGPYYGPTIVKVGESGK